MADRKSINMNQEQDIQQWKDIKMKEINEREDPDLGDTELLREMMDTYEEVKPSQ